MLTNTEKRFTIFFFLIVVAELLCGSIESLAPYRYVTKPSIVISLLLFFWKDATSVVKRIRIWTLLALAFSLLGDILLMFVDQAAHYFMMGLVAFLVAHLCYVLVFLKHRNTTKKPILLLVILVTYAIGFMALLWDGLGAMRLPVLMYMLVILTMAITAFWRVGKVSKMSYQLVCFGAILFLISDSLLAIDTFYKSFTFANIFIMLTYALAQYLIVFGIKKQS